jgi:cytochrome P450
VWSPYHPGIDQPASVFGATCQEDSMSISNAVRRGSRPLGAVPSGMDLAPVPGDPGLPLLGYTLPFLRDPNKLSRQRFDRYGPVSWADAFGIRVIALIGPEAAEVVFTNRDKAFASGSGWDFFIGPFFRRGLMLLDFEEHLHHRRIMQQAFTNARLRGYLEKMNPVIKRGLDAWQPNSGFLVAPTMKQLMLDVAAEIFMGVELGPNVDRVNHAFLDMVRAGLAFVRFPVPGGRWFRGLRQRQVLERFFTELLPTKRASEGDDLFAALCRAETEDGQRFTDEDIVNHMIFLLLAAHDTTRSTLTSMTYYLAKHPEWQDKARAESLALGTSVVGFDDLDQLSTLDLVMKESLRLVTPVPGVARQTVKDTEVLGHFVPKGMRVLMPLFFNHHMHEYWPDPERFDPMRFSDERREDKVHRFAWAPFGNGVHKCIGMHFASVQVKAVLHQLLLRYQWSVPDDYEMPLDFTTLPEPADDLPVRLERR